VTDIAVLDRVPVCGGFGPDAMERSPSPAVHEPMALPLATLSDQWRSNGSIFRIELTEE